MDLAVPDGAGVGGGSLGVSEEEEEEVILLIRSECDD